MLRAVFVYVITLVFLFSWNQSALAQNDLDQLSLTSYQQCVQVAEQRIRQNNEDFEAHYYAAVCLARIGYNETSNDRRMEIFERALTHAKKAYEMKPDDYRSNHAMGMTLGRTAEFSSARDRVAKSREIKKYADRAIELNPEHGGSWIVYGQLMFRVANLSSAERLAANVLFGGFPFEATNDLAIEAISNAIKYEPDFIYHYLQLARVYLTVKNDAKAREILEKAVNIEPTTPDDPDHIDTCRRLLDRLS